MECCRKETLGLVQNERVILVLKDHLVDTLDSLSPMLFLYSLISLNDQMKGGSRGLVNLHLLGNLLIP